VLFALLRCICSYHPIYHSIFPMGDISALIPDNEADVCILEEPEHLNWYVLCVGGFLIPQLLLTYLLVLDLPVQV
jgi:hypothetical protein